MDILVVACEVGEKCELGVENEVGRVLGGVRL